MRCWLKWVVGGKEDHKKTKQKEQEEKGLLSVAS